MLRRQGESFGMKKSSLLAVPVLLSSLLALGQAQPSPGSSYPGPGPGPSSDSNNSDQKEPKLGSYHLVLTFWTPGPTTHMLTPQPAIELKAASLRTPNEVNGTIPIPDQYVFDSIPRPSYDCMAASNMPHGCDSLDATRLVSTDPKSVTYRFGNHGPAVKLGLNIQVRDLIMRSQQDAEVEWKADQVIFVAVPKATPQLNVVSETLVGTWGKEAIVFEPGKPLSESAKKGLEDLNVKQDLGDKILYSYRVKSPKK